MFFHFWIKIIAASYFLTGRSRVGDSLRMITSEEETIIKCFLFHLKCFTHLAPGEQLGFRCLAQGSHISHGQFLPELRFEPTTSGYKSDALSITATTQITY